MGYCCGVILVLVTTVVLVSSTPSRSKRETAVLEPGNWDSCKPGAEAPPTRVPTQDRVQGLRTYFASNYIQAYIVPSGDAHQSEYPSNYDKRRGFVSGFQGSAGIAVITMTKAALWTDGRYFLEAEDTLDCGWILMRQDETGVPGLTDWLKMELLSGNRVGASPFLIGSSTWKKYEDELKDAGIHMLPINNELVDMIWNAQLRPDLPNSDINVLPMEFAGRSWQDKVTDMRAEMTENNADMLIVTGLDETAWLFNLRASDISYNPFFISYAILEDTTVRLYLVDHLNKIAKQPSDAASNTTVADYLNTNSENGTCQGREGLCVEVKLYSPETIIADVIASVANASKVWVSYACNYAIYSRIDPDKIYQANTPIATTKTKKNPTEVAGMKNAHIRDAVALVSFVAKLEKEVKEGKHWTELSAAEELDEYRRQQDYNRGLSFDSISGSGPNGAIIHYAVSNITDRAITTSDMYLLDSGGQYLDGTTDVTRTFHFGTPTDYQKECYTRVLMGHIDLFQAIWAKGLYGREVDAFARAPLWDVGLVYRHGTGHGIGMYLSVHEAYNKLLTECQPTRILMDPDESYVASQLDPSCLQMQSVKCKGPGRISASHALNPSDNPLDEHQFFSDGPNYISKSTYASTDKMQILDEYQFISDEPGYYEDGQFGIRLENIVMVTNATTKYKFPNTQFLTFEHITFVPYEPNLIQYELLSEKQINYLNNYNTLCREKVGPELKRQGETAGYKWLMDKTAIVKPKTSGSNNISSFSFQLVFLLVAVIHFWC